MFFAVIRRAYEGSAFHIIKSKPIADFAEFCKFIRMNKTNYGQMFFCWLEILANRNDINSIISQVFYGLNDFSFFFTETEHDTALRAHAAFFENLQCLHASPIPGLDAHLFG